MIKEALHSLKNDFDRAMFYWLVFVLSSMFMFMFFHLSLSEVVGVTFIHSENNIATTLTVLVILICMVVIFMANDFYVRKKSKELAMILVCGGSYLQLVEYLLIQTGFLMLLSIPIGIMIGYFAFPLLNMFLSLITEYQVSLHLNLQAIISTIIVISFEIFWCTLLNLGYTYRNSVKSLLQGEEKIKLGGMPFSFKISISKYFYLILYIGCAILLYTCGNNTSGMLILSIIGLVGMNGCIQRIVIPVIDQWIKEKWIDDDEKIVYMGFLREDLKLMRIYIFIFISTSIILLTLMATSVSHTIEMTLCLLSYCVMNCLLSLSLMFRFSTEAVGRKAHFLSLEKIGYVQSQQKSIMKKELIGLYGFIMVSSFIYILNIMIVLYINRYINISIVGFILISFVLPLIICCIINYIYYKKILNEKP